jgi:hypothetical protein
MVQGLISIGFDSSILFSSNEAHDQAELDSSTFQPFKTMNSVLVQRLSEALESIPEDSNGTFHSIIPSTWNFAEHISSCSHFTCWSADKSPML